jgi:hypothetical protein
MRNLNKALASTLNATGGDVALCPRGLKIAAIVAGYGRDWGLIGLSVPSII